MITGFILLDDKAKPTMRRGPKLRVLKRVNGVANWCFSTFLIEKIERGA